MSDVKFPRKLMITYSCTVYNEKREPSMLIARAFIPVLEPLDDENELLTGIEDVANQSITQDYDNLNILSICDITDLLKDEE
jgi:hypothetical protein